ncbi:RipA family octameric membrane protein [Kineobactrum salinum]
MGARHTTMDDQAIKLEIYKSYAGSVYSFEDRAQVTSRLFVTLNLAVTSAIAYGFSNESLTMSKAAFAGLVVCAVLFCIVWWLILASITRHTTAKHEVLQEMENIFPLKPYTDEWHQKLNSGRGYLKTTTLHELFPLVFIASYTFLVVIHLTNA